MCIHTYVDLYANYLSEDKLLFAKLTSLKCAQAGKSALAFLIAKTNQSTRKHHVHV